LKFGQSAHLFFFRKTEQLLIIIAIIINTDMI